jgi:hypothetical protein
MASLTIRRPVALQVIVTEEFKKELTEELQEAADAAERRMEQIDYQARHLLAELQRQNLNQAMAARQQIEAEKRKQEAVRKELLQQIEEVGKLELGSEFPRGTLEGTVEIKDGDNLFAKLGQTAIVVKDGVVVEIREA